MRVRLGKGGGGGRMKQYYLGGELGLSQGGGGRASKWFSPWVMDIDTIEGGNIPRVLVEMLSSLPFPS